jgi:hypothetical protein
MISTWLTDVFINKTTNGRQYDKPCIEIIFCLPVNTLAILIAASTASDPEFQKKNESSEG